MMSKFVARPHCCIINNIKIHLNNVYSGVNAFCVQEISLRKLNDISDLIKTKEVG